MGLMSRLKAVFLELQTFWRSIVVIGTPLVLLPFVFIWPDPEVECAYVVMVMAIYWMTAVIPMGITGLLPVIMFPMFGLVSVPDVATNYIKNVQLVLMGSMFVAIAIEQQNFHRRLALKSLLAIGTSPRRLLFGIMFISWFLSFWLPNVAVTAMMVPIVEALVRELVTAAKDRNKPPVTETRCGDVKPNVEVEQGEKPTEVKGQVNLALDTDNEDGIKGISVRSLKSTNNLPSLEAAADEPTPEPPEDYSIGEPDVEFFLNDPFYDDLAAMFAIATAYASNIGGIATLIGTNPNLRLYDLIDETYADLDMKSPLTYATWLPMGLPSAFIALIFCFLLLKLYFLRGNCLPGSKMDALGDPERSRKVLQKQYDQLGPMAFGEISTLFFFILLILLFFFRDPGFMEGYGSLFGKPLTDAVPAMFVAALLFIFPSKMPKLFFLREKNEGPESVPSLIDWKTSGPRLPWSALLLIGGAFAIEMGARQSGLSDWMQNEMSSMGDMPDTAVLCICMLLVTVLTNVTCGMATSSIFLPIYISMAKGLGLHPLYLTAPSCLMASSTFMLPASNPTNAIVYETGLLRIKDMIICGFFMNILFFLINLLAAETWIAALFDFNTLPWNGTVDSTTQMSHLYH